MKKIIIVGFALAILFIFNQKASAETVTVPAGGDLQGAINKAQPGDTILLQSGATFVGPIVLKNKSGSGWITIRSSGNLPPSGTRIQPSDAGLLAKIVAPGQNEPALETEAGAHNYKIIGLEFAKQSPTSTTDTLILAGDGSSAQNQLSEVPHDLVFEQIYVHGDSTSDLKRGLALNSASTTIADSYFSDIHSIGVDSQAIAGWNGPGPFTIQNNYLSAAGENFLLGGADPSIPNLVPSDIDFENNYVFKPLSWQVGASSYAGQHWSVKNLLELKNAERATIKNNIFENNWSDGQSGYAILFTVRNQDGNCLWCVVQNINFQNNIIRNSVGGFDILGHDDNNSSQLTQNISIVNNLWESLSGNWGLILSGTSQPGPSGVVISGNTVSQAGNFITFASYENGVFVQKPHLTITDNIGNYNQYGVIGDNAAPGDDSLNKYMPDGVFTDNTLLGGSGQVFQSHSGNSSTMPSGLYRADGDAKVYSVDSQGQKRWVQTLAIFDSYGFQWPSVKIIPSGLLPEIPDNNLIRANGDAKVYQLIGTTKHWITNPDVFNAHGFKWQNIDIINQTELNTYTTGSTIS